MASFDNGVSAPGGASYTAPLLNFQQIANWAKDYQDGQLNAQQQQSNQQQQKLNDQKFQQNESQFPYQLAFDKQQQTLNNQRIQQGQTALDLAKAFPNGLPIDPKTGSVDYQAVAQTFAKFGDPSGAVGMMQQQAPPQSSFLTGGTSAQSVPAKPLPPPGAGPQGDPGAGTITDLVTARLPEQDASTGQTIGKIAQLLGVDPNAQLTPGQTRRAQGLLERYAPGDGGSSAGVGAGNGSSMPPSANAVSPAPPAASSAPSNFKDRFAAGGAPPAQAAAPAPPQPSPQQQSPAPATPQPPQPPQPPQQQQPQGGPITPQVPLPKGYTDPQQAILALNAEAARLAANPRAKGQVDALKDWASRIEESIKPVDMHPGTNRLDPRTGQPLYQGNQSTMDPAALNAAAERYLETGQLPPNMGRGAQGSANSTAIQNAASQLATQRGIDPATLPGKWQQFKAQQVAIQRFTSGKQGDTIKSFNVLVDHLDTLGDAAQALKNGDIRFFNQWKQTFASQTGGTAPTNFDGVKALVGDEIVKAVVGGAGALADREEVKKDLDRASSPKQLAELVDKYRKLALGQLKGLRKQYEVATGQKNFGELLLPGTLAALGGTDGKGAAIEDAGGTPTKDGWTVVTLPNGSKTRVQEVQ